MESEDIDVVDESGDGGPVCVRCMEPVDPLGYYCPHCGEATGQLTQYLPFVNIPWLGRTWGRIWRQVWSREVSIAGRLFRFFLIVWTMPFMLIGLLFMGERKTEKDHPEQVEGDSDSNS